jgi:Trehalase
MTATADRLRSVLTGQLRHDRAETSFSPCFSDIGFTVDRAQAGIARLCLHYNRRTAVIGSPFLALPATVAAQHEEPLAIVQEYVGGGRAALIGSARNAFFLDVSGLGGWSWHPLADAAWSEPRIQALDERTWLWRAYRPRGDERDPDRFWPVAIACRVLHGAAVADGAGINLAPQDGVLRLALTVQVLDTAENVLTSALDAVPDGEAATLAQAASWWRRCVGPLTVHPADPAEELVLAKAVHSLAANATRAPGLLAGRVAAFPSRGAYPTHFLWDSCFQNLALELMDPQLAPDSLLLLTENLRVDGMMPHFLCSTWMRPLDSQPPLVGWAGLRLVCARDDRGLAARLLPALVRNNRWWLNCRMTRHGLIASQHPMETGWDDTPRFDQGPVVALDMNSYLIMQMRATAQLARLLGESAIAAEAEARAAQLSQRLLALCLDRERGLFFDVVTATGQRLAIASPAAFLPLLAGVLAREPGLAQRMIRDHLLAPGKFFGAIPFPCVAYDEPSYQPGLNDDRGPAGHGAACWRGTCWLPIAWLMLEVLERYGHHAERRAAMQRLYRMVIADGRLCEYFRSDDGRGLGAVQQGWTAAITIRMHQELRVSSQ